ncbi:MAG TPA: serine hydrolase domain-containing protein [Caldilineaceae bacterium]|nr:serine hydrolase domain-containing protein [Caldilineaceae bacterium]
MQVVQPEELGFAGERLARIKPKMQAYVDENQLAGISTLIARRGKVAHFEHVGMADIDAGTPISADTIFRIYSMTKPITSVAALMLMEEGHFRLSDPVADYLPEFKDCRVLAADGVLAKPSQPMTIRHLLTHTAGLSYGFDEYSQIDRLYREHGCHVQGYEKTPTLAAWITAIAQQPLAYHPGTQYRYSVAIDVLGYLVEVVSGMGLADFLAQRIFAPLGMTDTFFTVPPEKLDRFAANYGPREGGGLTVIDAPRESRYARPTLRPSGGGGLLSTAVDYLRFAQMLLNGGVLNGVQLLGRKTVELMTTNHLPDGVYVNMDATVALGMGLGVSVLRDLGKGQLPGSVGNYGWGGAANTNFWVDPQEDLLGIIMLQFMPSGTYPVVPDFRIMTYAALVD